MKNSLKIIAKVLVLFLTSALVIQILVANFLYPRDESFTNKVTFQKLWEIEFDDRVCDEWDISEDGILACAEINNLGIFQLNVNDGSLLSKSKLQTEYFEATLKIDGNSIFCKTDSGPIYEFDIKNNSMIRGFKAGETLLPVDIFRYKNKLITVYYPNGIIKIYDLEKGKFLKLIYTKHVLLFAEVDNGMLYYSGMGYNVHAVNLDTLDAAWEYEEPSAHTYKNPIISNGEIYLNNAAEMLIFNGISGDIVKRYPLSAINRSIDGDYLFSYSPYKLEKRLKSSGELLWSLDVSVGKLVVMKDTLLYRDKKSNKLCNIDKETRKLNWQIDWKGYSIKKVEETREYFVIRRDDNAIFVVNKNTGEKLWKKSSKRHLFGPEARDFKVYNDILVIYIGPKSFEAYRLSK